MSVLPSLAFALGLNASLSFPVSVQFEPMSNLTYQLDLVAGRIGHERTEPFEKLWKAEFLKSPEDEAMVKRWKENRDAPRTPGDSRSWPISSPSQSFDGEAAVRAAGFDSRNPNEYRVNIAKVLPASQGSELAKVVDYFTPRFSRWFETQKAGKASSFVSSMKSLLESEKIQSWMSKMAGFYGYTPNPQKPLPFILLINPSTDPNAWSSGQQLGPYSLAQFFPHETPEDRADVILHEFCHYLYGAGPESGHRTLQTAFVNEQGDDVMPAFYLLDEALATAIGNGIIRSFFRSEKWFAAYTNQPLSWYGEEGIDRSGKSSYTLVRESLDQGKSLFEESFVKAYLSAVRKEFGPALSAPKYQVRYVNLLSYSDWVRELGNTVRGAVRVSSMGMSSVDFKTPGELEILKSDGCVTAILFAKPTDLPKLVTQGFLAEDDLKRMRLAVRRQGFASAESMAKRRAKTYIVSALTVEAAQQGLESLLK